MAYKLVIFDWDGTLMDSQAKIVECMQHACVESGLPKPNAEQVKNIIGISLVPAIKIMLNTDDQILAESVALAYKDAYLKKDSVACSLFEGVEDMLRSLATQNRLMAVATGKARRGLARAWQQTNTGHYFKFSCCADEAESKPHPDMLSQILTASGFGAEDSVMIGDSEYDMAMARAIGMDSIAVSYGVHDVERLSSHSPKHIVDDVLQMHKILAS